MTIRALKLTFATAGLAAAFVAALSVTAITGIAQTPEQRAQRDSLPPRWTADQCPNVPSAIKDSAGKRFLIPIAEETMDIHEFHDCQRMVIRAPRERTFGPLIGVWSHQALKSFDEAAFRKRGGVLAAQIYNYSGERYEVLGIRPGHNCLYLGFSKLHFWKFRPHWWAYMVPITGNSKPVNPSAGVESNAVNFVCPERLPVNIDRTRLTVTRLHYPAATGTNYPPVARWDWDDATGQQMIGIRCAVAWCEISTKAAAESAPTAADLQIWDWNAEQFQAIGLPGYSEMIKGWYDEQELAISDGAAGLKPSGVRARFYPTPGFSSDWAWYAEDWRAAGIISLQSTLAGAATKPYYQRGLHVVWLQLDSETEGRAVVQPITGMFSLSGPPPSGLTQFRVVRIKHESFDEQIPRTMRWRWVNTDDELWEACAAGCCNVQGPCPGC
jgi:hypothetical protein